MSSFTAESAEVFAKSADGESTVYDNNYYVVGVTSSGSKSFPLVQSTGYFSPKNNGKIDAFIAKFDLSSTPLTGLNKRMHTTEKQVRVFPNPTSSTIEVTCDRALWIDGIIVMDMYEKTLVQKGVNKHERSYKLDVSDIPIGVYLIKLIPHDGEVTYTKFIRN